jgi:hypothetical protein
MMLPPASPMMVQTWPSTPGASRMVAVSLALADGVALGLGRPLQVAPDLFAALEGLQLGAVDDV